MDTIGTGVMSSPAEQTQRRQEGDFCNETTETPLLQVLDSTIPSDADTSLSEPNDRICSTELDDCNGLNAELSTYGFSLSELYKHSVEFYKRGKKALNLSYEDKLQLTAYWKQISAGTYDSSKMQEIGYLDVIGNDRRRAWQALGDMSATEAMESFCKLLKDRCNAFTPYMEAQKRDRDERERVRLEAIEKARKEEEERRRIEEEKRMAELAAERKRLKEEAAAIAAEEARRKLEEEKQREEELKKQQEQLAAELAQSEEQTKEPDDSTSQQTLLYNPNINGVTGRVIAPASLWTRPKLQEFITHVKRDASSVIVVGRGETVTIRVPTHENGSCLFWEFATESYDVGFGVYFEWSISSSQEVSVNVDESDGDSDYDITKEDTENEHRKPLVDEVLPVLRRNSHLEVIVGSHIYPGTGVYLLKFDNSYSLLRSKTLYYRVYYTR